MIIEFLYPAVGNLYGEAMHMRFIEQCFPEAQVINTQLTDMPAFHQQRVDFVFIGAMPEHGQERAIDSLNRYKDSLEAAIESGVAFLATGNALEIFGQYIEKEDGTKIPALGIFPTYAKRDMAHRYNSLYLGDYKGINIVGYKAQFSHSYGEIGEEGAFSTIRGDGLHPGAQFEGIHRNNFLGTYLLGPLLILNPEFTKAWALEATGKEIEIPYEAALYSAYQRRLSEYTRSGIKY